MKTKFLRLALCFSIVVLMFSCNKDEDVDLRDNFKGTYNVEEKWSVNGTSYTCNYTMTIEKSTQTSNLILLVNIADFGAGVLAEATIDNQRMTIPQQTLSNHWGISGSGTLNGNVLSFSYQQSKDGYQYNVNATATKK